MRPEGSKRLKGLSKRANAIKFLIKVGKNSFRTSLRYSTLKTMPSWLGEREALHEGETRSRAAQPLSYSALVHLTTKQQWSSCLLNLNDVWNDLNPRPINANIYYLGSLDNKSCVEIECRTRQFIFDHALLAAALIEKDPALSRSYLVPSWVPNQVISFICSARAFVACAAASSAAAKKQEATIQSN